MPTYTKVYIVEDHAILRQILCQFIKHQPGLCLVGEVATAEAALKALLHVTVELMLIDVSLPMMNGIELVRRIHRYYPEVPCLMLSGHSESHYVKQALAAGACGYLFKDHPSELPEAIEQVLKGRIYIDSSLENSSGSRSPLYHDTE